MRAQLLERHLARGPRGQRVDAAVLRPHEHPLRRPEVAGQQVAGMATHARAACREPQPPSVAERGAHRVERTALQHDDRVRPVPSVMDHAQRVAAPATARRARHGAFQRRQAGWDGGRHERHRAQRSRSETLVDLQDVRRAAGRRAQHRERHAHRCAERPSHPGATLTGNSAPRPGRDGALEPLAVDHDVDALVEERDVGRSPRPPRAAARGRSTRRRPRPRSDK